MVGYADLLMELDKLKADGKVADWVVIDPIKVIPFHLGDCSLNGVSKGKTEMYIAFGTDEADQYYMKEVDAFKELLIPVDRILFGKPAPYIKPLHDKPGLGPMSGGNIAEYKDGTQIKIHDRYESAELYEKLSR